MLNKMAVKLSFYFTIALVLLSLVMTTVFTVLLKEHTLNLHQLELETRATTIAKTLSDFYQDSSEGGIRKGNSGSGYGAYLRFISDIAGTNIWLIDEQRNLLSTNKGVQKKYVMDELPEHAIQLIDEVFKDQTVFSKDFSGLLDQVSLTVGTPIYNSQGTVVGAVLLHSPVSSVNNALKQGINILMLSLILAVIFAMVLAVFLSFRFTKPLETMKDQAMNMAKGKYERNTYQSTTDEVGELAFALNELAKRLRMAEDLSQETEQLRRDFIANISHELRTPITVLLGSLEALNDHVVNDQETIDRFYAQMLIETKYLQRLVGDLLELAKLQNADFVIDKEELLFNELVEHVVNSFRPIAESRSIQLYLEMTPNEIVIHGDYGRLRQLLIVLMDNAIKFSPDESPIRITLNPHVLQVQDYGIGISEGELSHIFEKFYKTRNENNKLGTGLGLAIAYQIAKRHQMEIEAASDLGKGTTFTLYFK